MSRVSTVPFLDLSAATRELRREIHDAIVRVTDSGWYIGGAEVEMFEREFSAYCGVEHCVGVANGLDALMLLLRASGIGQGDEVIVPSNTYIATWLAITHVGARVLPVEPRLATANIDPARVEAAITSSTRAIMAVHLYGQTAEMDALREIATRRRLRLFEDAAQAHGAAWRGRRAGALSDAAGWSFYPGKNLGALGDGGAVTTNDAGLADRLRVLRNYGSRVKYFNDVVGFNSRLDPLQAAVLRVKLAHLDPWNQRRQQLAARYLDAFADCRGLILPTVADGSEAAWHLFVIRVPERDRIQQLLTADGIQTLIHYPVPPHLSGAYRQLGWSRGQFPIAEQLAEEVLSLPIGPQLATEQQDRVIAAVKRVAA